MIKMIKPRVLKKYGKKGNEQFYRFELIGDGLLKTDNICFTWAENIQALKIKVQRRIEQFMDRQFIKGTPRNGSYQKNVRQGFGK